MEQGWFNAYVVTELGDVPDCNIAHISDDYRTITVIADSLLDFSWSGSLWEQHTGILGRYVNCVDVNAMMKNRQAFKAGRWNLFK